MNRPDLIELRRFADELADSARATTLRWFRRPVPVQTKSDASPVTRADKDTEQRLRDLITERYPDHGIYGEEFGHLNPNAEYQWIIDPIDGTKSFIAGVPTFGSLIGVLRSGEPVIGIIDMPAMHERFVGVAGRPSVFNANQCATRDCARLEDARVFATAPDMFTDDEFAIVRAIGAEAAMARFGLDCYAYALLAAGHIDVVIESDLKPHDILPIVPVIEGAGGYVSDWDGRPLTLESGPQVLAAGSDGLAIQVLDRIKRAR